MEAFEILFFAAFSQKIQKLGDHIDLIKSKVVPNDQRSEQKENQIKSKNQIIQQLSTTIKNIQTGFELGMYEGQEAQKAKEVKKYKNDIKILEDEIEAIKAEKETDQGDHFEEIFNNMKKFFSGKDNPNISGKESNEILRDFIEAIFYNKEGREITIDIVWKKELKEIN